MVGVEGLAEGLHRRDRVAAERDDVVAEQLVVAELLDRDAGQRTLEARSSAISESAAMRVKPEIAP